MQRVSAVDRHVHLVACLAERVDIERPHARFVIHHEH
jgi:hypothetical protein